MTRYSLTIYNDIYPKVALQNSKKAYEQFASFETTPAESGVIRLVITVKPRYAAQSEEVYREFLNYLLDSSIQLLMEKSA